MHTKSSKPLRMFQWDAIDTNPDLGGQNVLKTVEMAIRHNSRRTRTESESFRSLDLFWVTFINILSGPLTRGTIAPIAPYGSATVYEWVLILDDRSLRFIKRLSLADDWTIPLPDATMSVRLLPRVAFHITPKLIWDAMMVKLLQFSVAESFSLLSSFGEATPSKISCKVVLAYEIK